MIRYLKRCLFFFFFFSFNENFYNHPRETVNDAINESAGFLANATKLVSLWFHSITEWSIVRQTSSSTPSLPPTLLSTVSSWICIYLTFLFDNAAADTMSGWVTSVVEFLSLAPAFGISGKKSANRKWHAIMFVSGICFLLGTVYF